MDNKNWKIQIRKWNIEAGNYVEYKTLELETVNVAHFGIFDIDRISVFPYLEEVIIWVTESQSEAVRP